MKINPKQTQILELADEALKQVNKSIFHAGVGGSLL
jgi:hypothetical protein